MATGMLLAGVAFIVAGVVQFKVDAGDRTLGDGETKLVVFNAFPGDVPSALIRIEGIDGNISFPLHSGEASFGKFYEVMVFGGLTT